ncbi:Collagen alpha-5(VI) chain [Bulinus truncatus]|nr:Collagen alpha-5(VI) chain [Bulinus truncatus]
MRILQVLVFGCLIVQSVCLFDLFNQAVQGAGNLLGGAVDATGHLLGGAGQVVGNVVEGAANTAGQILTGTGEIIGGAIVGGADLAGQIISGTGELVNSALWGLGDFAGQILGTGVGIFDAGVDMFGNTLKTAVTIGEQAAGSIVDTGVNVICSAFGRLVNCRDLPGHGSVAPLPFQCRGKADIIFVVDASGSVGSLNFKKLLSFAANLAGSYLIGPDNTRFGLVVFSTEYQKVFDLKTFKTPLEVIQAILKTPNSGGLTYTDKALNSIINNRMFDPINGGRSDARDIVITLTDGQSNNPTATAAAANALKTKGATLFSVGIGWGNNNGELVKLASNAEFVFNVDNFDRLDNFLYQLAQKTCASSGGVEKPVIACQAQADIVLVIDSSGSIGPKNYWKVLNFTVDLANQFQIGKNGVLFGSVVFSDNAQKWFDLKDNLNIESLRRILLKTPYLNSTTSTDKALDLVRNANMFGRSAGGRDGAQNIVILITDGASDYPDKTIAAAGKLKTLQDTSIITLGIGNAKRAELEAVASSKSDVFLVNSFDALNNVKQNIANRACAHSKKK